MYMYINTCLASWIPEKALILLCKDITWACKGEEDGEREEEGEDEENPSELEWRDFLIGVDN